MVFLSSSGNYSNLIRLFAHLFSGTLSRQSLLHPALRSGLQIKGVALHFFDDLFRLHLALEPPQGIVDGLPLLQSNFSQTNTSQVVPIGELTAVAVRLSRTDYQIRCWPENTGTFYSE